MPVPALFDHVTRLKIDMLDMDLISLKVELLDAR
jgi:hypothetical protein